MTDAPNSGAVAARPAAARAALFLLVLLAAALPILVPHVDFLGGSSLRVAGTGRSAIRDSPRSVTRSDRTACGPRGPWDSPPRAGCLRGPRRRSRPPSWRLALAASGLSSWPSEGLALVAYVLTSPLLVEARWFRSLVLEIPFGDVYHHNPGRLRYVAVLALPILAATGLQGLVDRPLPPRAALGWLGAAGFAFVLWPLAAGRSVVAVRRCSPVRPRGRRRCSSGSPIRRWRWTSLSAIVGLLTVELLGSAVYAQVYEGGTIFTGLETGHQSALVPQVLRFPELSEADYLTATPIVHHLRANPGRYATWAPPAAFFEKGYLWMKSPLDWPALAPSRGTLFRVPDALGYNPVQLPRYWRYIRTTNELSVFYNASVLNEPSVERCSPVQLPLPDRSHRHRAAGRRPGCRGSRRLLPVGAARRAAPGDRCTQINDEFVDDARSAMDAITTDDFDPSEETVIELTSERFGRVFTCVGDCAPPRRCLSPGDLRVGAGGTGSPRRTEAS